MIGHEQTHCTDYGRKDLWKKQAFSLKWKSEGVVDVETTASDMARYGTIWHLLMPITQPSLGLFSQMGENLSEIWPKRHVKFHANL